MVHSLQGCYKQYVMRVIYDGTASRFFNHFVIRHYVTYKVDTAFLNNLRCKYEQIFVFLSFVFFACTFIEVGILVFSISQFTPESTNTGYVLRRSTLTQYPYFASPYLNRTAQTQRRGRKSYIHTRKRFQPHDPKILAT
jgi:hypothetical protein